MESIVREEKYIARVRGEDQVFHVQELVAGPEQWPKPFRIQLAASSSSLGKTIFGITALDAIDKASEHQFSTALLWKGEPQRIFNHIRASLEAQGIPLHFNETVNRSARNGLLRLFMGQVKSTLAYEVWVFSSDLERARVATRFTGDTYRQTNFRKPLTEVSKPIFDPSRLT